MRSAGPGCLGPCRVLAGGWCTALAVRADSGPTVAGAVGPAGLRALSGRVGCERLRKGRLCSRRLAYSVLGQL